ncbi:hypothetical protein VKT23_015635 [Stygiomarasmius scandens]|uniref:Uncharacterized protein n=1 Tax=Marasmiellus scandens TaxID=2682957 RepID=A0ABR1J1C1_9AGAR
MTSTETANDLEKIRETIFKPMGEVKGHIIPRNPNIRIKIALSPDQNDYEIYELTPRIVRNVPYIANHGKFNVKNDWEKAKFEFGLHQRLVLKANAPRDGSRVLTLEDYELPKDDKGKPLDEPPFVLTALYRDSKQWFYMPFPLLSFLLEAKVEKELYRAVRDAIELNYDQLKVGATLSEIRILNLICYGHDTGMRVSTNDFKKLVVEKRRLNINYDKFKPNPSTKGSLAVIEKNMRVEIEEKWNNDYLPNFQLLDQFQVFCDLATNAQRGIAESYNCLMRTWDKGLSRKIDLIVYLKKSVITTDDFEELKKELLGTNAPTNAPNQPKATLLKWVELKPQYERPEPTLYDSLGSHLLGYYEIFIRKGDWAAFPEFVGNIQQFPSETEINTIHGDINHKWTQAYTKTSLSKDKIDMTSIHKRIYGSNRDQAGIMGKQRAPMVVKDWWGLGNDTENSAEWLHRSGFALGGMGEELAQPLDSQVPENLVLGTYQANSLMLRYEQSLARVVKFLSSVADAGTAWTVGHLVTEIETYTVIPTYIDAKTNITKSRTDIDTAQKYLKTNEGKGCLWLAPMLSWRVKFEEPPTLAGRDAYTESLCISYTDPYPQIFECFSKRTTTKLEMLLDELVEDHVFYKFRSRPNPNKRVRDDGSNSSLVAGNLKQVKI